MTTIAKKDWPKSAKEFIDGNPEITKYGTIAVVTGIVAMPILAMISFFGMWFVVDWLINLITDLNLSRAGGLGLSFVTTGLIYLGIVLTAIGSVLKMAGRLGKQLGDNCIAVISVFLAWIIGIILPVMGFRFVEGYCLPLWINAILIFISFIIVLWSTDLAFEHVIPIKSKKWGEAVTMIAFLFIFGSAFINVSRADYFDTKTGNVKVWVTPSTLKVWRHKPDKYDASTGEEIIVPTKERIKKVRDRQFKLGDILKGEEKPPPPAKTWKIKYTKSFIGKGSNVEINIAEAGKDIKYNDTVVVEGREFRLKEYGKWVKYTGKYKEVSKYTGGRGNFLKANAPLGEIIGIKVLRFEF